MAGFGVSRQVVLTYAVLGVTSIAAFFPNACFAQTAIAPD